MATFNQGIVGGFSGKVGPVIGSSFRGLNVMKSRPKKSNKPATIEQLTQRMRFRLAVSFLSPLKKLIVKGFGSEEGTKSKVNLCVSHNTQHSLTGVYPNIALDFNKLVFTKGVLENVNATVSSSNGAIVDFQWANNSQMGLSEETDNAILVVYNPSTNRHVFMLTNVSRADSQASLQVYTSFIGAEVHCWIAFTDKDGKEYSTSSYIGTVIVA